MSNSEGENGSGPDLATIQRVELRDVWPHEADEFTPWLAENIRELGDALGMRLEVEEREAPVGSYSLDILARDQDDRQVVIENQLETTDHKHLGQLLTYAAGFDANVIVWVARNFRDEHRDALDLLNRRTGEDTEFFGIEVELWQIDDSRLAPYFKPIVTPNEWRKQTVRPTGGVSRRRGRTKRYEAFFQELVGVLRKEQSFTEEPNITGRSWCRLWQPVQGIWYTASFQPNIGESWIELMHGKPRRDVFDHLKEQVKSIESELGDSLHWKEKHGGGGSCIAAYRPGNIDDDEETLAEIRAWMVERLLKFKQVFGPRLDELVV